MRTAMTAAQIEKKLEAAERSLKATSTRIKRLMTAAKRWETRVKRYKKMLETAESNEQAAKAVIGNAITKGFGTPGGRKFRTDI